MVSELLGPNDPLYPIALRNLYGEESAPALAFLGPLDLLARTKLAFFCSIRCPGSLIVQAHDFAQSLRRSAVAVISGFKSPVEQECLTILLRGPAPVILCPARSIHTMTIKPEWRPALENGRLLVLSTFHQRARRPTARFAVERNRFVAALADRVVIAHAAEGSKTHELCGQMLVWRKPLFTFRSPINYALSELGVEALSLDALQERLVRP